MKNHTSIKERFTTTVLIFALLANHARAAVTYWDPEGTFTPTPPSVAYTGQPSSQTPASGSLAGTWENLNWSTASAGAATPVAWVEGTAACFAVGAGSTNNPNGTPDSTTTFTVTMNQNHTVAGMFNGSLAPNSCHVTIQGAGTITWASGNLNAMSMGTSSDGSTASIAINVPTAGSTTAGICAEQAGDFYLNGDSSGFAGGTYLGYNGSSFATGVWHFNNNLAFGTSPIILLNCIGGALVTETSGLTISNAVTMYGKFSANVNTIGSTPQPATLNVDGFGTPQLVTFSGPWQLANGSGWTGASIYASTSPWGNYTTVTLNTGHGVGDPSDLINISGPLSGSCALTKGGSGILELSGDNSAFSGPFTITNGTLRVGYPTGLGCNGAVSTNGLVTVASGTTSGTLDLNGFAVNVALVLNGTGNAGGNGALVNSNLTSTAVLNAPSGVLAALITSPFTSSNMVAPVTATVTGGGGSGAIAVPSLGVTPGTFTVTPNTQKYTVMPTITVSGGGGSNAIVPMPLSAASPAVVSSTAFITAPGFGYTSAPTVSVTGGTTNGAGTKPTVTANANNFQLMGIQITSPGTGYTSQPTITLNGTGVGSGTAVGLISSVTLGNSSSIGGPGNIIINSAIGDSGSGYALTKVGLGSVTLGAVNTYLGATTIGGGKLVGVVGGSCASSAVEAQTGSTLGVSIPDNTKQWTCASLTFDDNTTKSEFNFGSTTPSTTLAPLNVTGVINFAGTPTVTVLASSPLPAGTYPLMTAAGGLSGNIPTTANLNLPPDVSGTLSNDGTNVTLTVSGNTEPLKWALNGPGAWDINTTANWKDSTGASVNYVETTDVPPVGEDVVLDDTYISTSPIITLNTNVSPVSVAVNSTNNYTITGSGGIAGETGLTKTGSGTLELDVVNTFTGGTTIAAPGALTIGGAGQLGGGVYSASIANNGTLTYNSSAAQTLSGPITGTGALVENAGTLILSGANNYSGGTTIGAAGTLQVGDGVLYNGATVAGNIVDNGSLVFANYYPQTYSGNLTGSGSLTVLGPTSLTLSGIYSNSGAINVNAGSLIFNNAGSQSLPGAVSGAGTLVKAGSGTLTVSGANSYTGGTTVNGGILSVSGIDDSGFNPSGIGQSGTLTLGGGTFQYNGPAGAVTARTVSGTGTIDVAGGSSLELQLAKSGTITKTSTGTLILSGTADNASLGLTLNAGTVVLKKASTSTAHALGATTTVNSTGTLQLGTGGTGGDQIFSGVNVTVNSGGIFDANGFSEGMTSLTLNGAGSGSGALINNGGAATITTTAAAGFPLGSAVTVGGSGNLTMAGVVSGANSLTYGGSGTLTLSSANTFSGGLTISPGAKVTLGNAAGAGTGTVTINGNGILNPSVSATYANKITGGSTGVITVTTPSGNTLLTGDLSGFTGTVNCNGGQIVINNTNNQAHPISAASTWIIANGVTLDLATPYVTNAASVTVNGVGNNAFGSLRLDACNQTGPVLLNGTNCTVGNGNAAAGTISGVISDGGHGYGLTKVTNNLVLAATNTYTGPTTNVAGLLEISGSILGNLIVVGGTNQFDNTTALASTAALTLPNTPTAGSVNLNYSGTMIIAALNFGATSMAQGTWGAVGSLAAHTNGAFAGTGLLNVTSGGTTTTTVLGSVPSTLCSGANLNLSATVTGGNNGDTVQFLDGVTVLGTGTLSGGLASYSAVGLPNGPHSITAKYLGNNTANASTSSPAASVTVGPCQSPVTITSIVNNGNGTITINYIGGAGASFTLKSSPVADAPRSSWTPVGANNPATPGSFTVTPSGNTFYIIQSN